MKSIQKSKMCEKKRDLWKKKKDNSNKTQCSCQAYKQKEIQNNYYKINSEKRDNKGETNEEDREKDRTIIQTEREIPLDKINLEK